ncbi:MAG: hypothetical protein ACD_43C00190G0002 [uncultured bacterium]|nr:MAG: hypothetical protein ACD_43C00190G0002 [uncultured bacterium]
MIHGWAGTITGATVSKIPAVVGNGSGLIGSTGSIKTDRGWCGHSIACLRKGGCDGIGYNDGGNIFTGITRTICYR